VLRPASLPLKAAFRSNGRPKSASLFVDVARPRGIETVGGNLFSTDRLP